MKKKTGRLWTLHDNAAAALSGIFDTNCTSIKNP